MNCKIPFTKDIDFEKKVSEITSISLEHETKVEDGILKGNFIVSGDFKSHEVSVNKEAFSYILPFEIDLAEDVDPNTIEFMIEDFTYEIIDSSILRVNIDFNVIASLKEKEEEKPLFQDVTNAFLDTDTLTEDLRKTEEAKKEEKKESEEMMINNIKEEDSDYTTYHIHIVSEEENIETICNMYDTNINILQDYNDLTNIMPKDKIIIPENHE
mgnify:CR=1 FL=1